MYVAGSQPLVRPESFARPAAGALFALLDRIHAGGAFSNQAPSDAADERERRGAARDAHGGGDAPAGLLSAQELAARAEKNVDPGSRAFRRATARDELSRNSQAARHAFKDALQQGRQELRAALRQADGQPDGNSDTSNSKPVSNRAAQPADAASPKPGAAPADAGQADADPAPRPPASRAATAPEADPRPPVSRPPSSGQPNQVSPPIPMPAPTGQPAGATSGPPATAAAASIQAVGAAGPASGAGANTPSPPAAAGPAGPASTGSAAGPRNGGVARDSGGGSEAGTASSAAEREAETAERSARVDRAVKAMLAQYRSGAGVMKMRLDPPALGEIRVEMQLRDGAVTLRIDTHTDVAHRLLRDDVEALREGLEAGGLRLERFELRAQPSGPEGSGSESTPGQPDARDAGRHASGGANAERSSFAGTDATPHSDLPADDGLGGATGGQSTLAAETRVNVLA